MKYSCKEIECTLALYMIAKIKNLEITDDLAHCDSETKRKDLISDKMYYERIILTVDHWMSLLYDDEKLLINLRYFKSISLENISIKLNYAGHSGVLKKIHKIIQKLEEESFHTCL